MKPINLKGIKLEDLSEDDWQEVDELAVSIIMLSLFESVYFNVAEEKTSYGLWQKLCSLYEKQSAASQVYLLKKLFEPKMKDGTSMSSHFNDFQYHLQSTVSAGYQVR